MIFNSIAFITFFLFFFLFYWLVFAKSLKLQNLLLLAGCYFFYAWWDWRFLFVMIAYSMFNYKLGLYISKSTTNKKKHYLTLLASVVSIGLLGYFKYTNFFISSFVSAFAGLHVSSDSHIINIVLPLGISFYTFRTLSYIYDIKNGKVKPTDDWVVFFSFVAFFPCLVSGPIDRARNFIPQLQNKRTFDYNKAIDASRQILWGLFKKIVIADKLALLTDYVYSDYSKFRGSALLLIAIYYSFQLYADFSGYSDMAIGISKLLGFEVAKNFDFPFFSQNIADFWRRWHISLTGWLTEYVFTPVSISLRDYGKLGLIIAILTNLTVIGIWHGANWTYFAFGLLHGIFFIPLILKGTLNKKKKANPNKLFPGFSESLNMLFTFMLVTFSFILFRSANLAQAFDYFKKICSSTLFSFPVGVSLRIVPVIILFIIAEWLQRNKPFTLHINNLNPYLRLGIYYLLVFAIFKYSSAQVTQFIYLKF